MKESEKRIDFELFKSNVCHKVKLIGEIEFINEMKTSTEIHEYKEKQWYVEMLYLLAMTDYLCRKNNIKRIKIYEELRSYRMPEIVYPKGLLMLAKFSNNENILLDAFDKGITEFKNFNIIESEVDTNV